MGILLQLGVGARMVKLEKVLTYKSFAKKGPVYTLLPFGLRSAPKIYSTIADTLMWIIATGSIKGI